MPKNSGELSRSQVDVARFLTASCTIKRASDALTDDGYPADSESTVASGIACRIVAAPMNPWEQQSGGQVKAVSSYTILMPADTDIEPDDIIESGSQRFQVSGRTEPQTDEVVLPVVAVEIT